MISTGQTYYPASAQILVVERFDTMRKVISNQLKSLGWENILMAESEKQALQYLQSKDIDLILSGLPGPDLLKAVRSDEKNKHLAFLMVTAEIDRSQIIAYINAGVSDLIVKPYTSQRLLKGIKNASAWCNRHKKASAAKAAQIHKTNVTDIGEKKAYIPNILLVDDTPANLFLLTEIFKDEYKVRVAKDGMKALSICHSDNPPDLVLLDVMMPNMDGFEVARQMRDHPSSENIPIIFVTAMTSDEARLQGLQLGAVDFINKPVDPTILKPRVTNFLNYVKLHKQLQADYDTMLESAHLKNDINHLTSQDIKTPLDSIIKLAQDMANASDPLEYKRTLEQIEYSALQAMDKVNLSTELYKVESGHYTYTPQPIIMDKLLRRIIESCQTEFSTKSLNITLKNSHSGQYLPEVLGDQSLCYSIFQNLIKNACEAAPEETPILISVSDNNPVHITMRNCGVVPKAIRTRFFEKYVTHGKADANGLGAYAAKLFTETQKGSIGLNVSDTNGPHGTTTVIVTLPGVKK